jgi:hypothetical protein
MVQQGFAVPQHQSSDFTVPAQPFTRQSSAQFSTAPGYPAPRDRVFFHPRCASARMTAQTARKANPCFCCPLAPDQAPCSTPRTSCIGRVRWGPSGEARAGDRPLQQSTKQYPGCRLVPLPARGLASPACRPLFGLLCRTIAHGKKLSKHKMLGISVKDIW